MVGVEPEAADGVVAGADGYDGGEEEDQGQDDSLGDAPRFAGDFGAMRKDAAKAQPDDENPDEQNECWSDLVVEIHETPRRFDSGRDHLRGLFSCLGLHD
jgi:hypothetical protein